MMTVAAVRRAKASSQRDQTFVGGLQAPGEGGPNRCRCRRNVQTAMSTPSPTPAVSPSGAGTRARAATTVSPIASQASRSGRPVLREIVNRSRPRPPAYGESTVKVAIANPLKPPGSVRARSAG
jgi:hypothetical protein